ncbi:MAG: fibronectin type III domain-containing protein, partial [Bacteroidales bacterium]|nr:fibronectin type III domain-containing protein [Bacteroidales bacterium]
MRKLFLTLVTALLCSIVSFAQSGIIEISSAEDFLKIGKNGGYNAGSSFQQTADIDLGAFTKDTAIIPTFSGTYDGNGYSITYQASFTADNNDEKLGLFGTVTGIIKNLNLTNCSMTASSEGEYTANIALLCAYLNGANALVTDCKVVNGEIRSTIMTGEAFARVATGMLVGHLKNGKVEYSSADGVVVGMGYVGGLVGQSSAGKVTGSSFSGDVTATFNSAGLLDWAGDAWGTGRGGYAGGIVGFANEGSTIQFCYVNADITAPDMPTGVGGTNIAGAYPGFLGMQPTGKPTVTNNYCEGTINGNTLSAKNITNSAGNTATNYFPDGSYTNGGTVNEMTPEEIASALNTAVGNSNYDEDKIQFSSPDDNVIFGVVIDEDEDQTCGVPTNLVVSNNAGTCTATWESAADEEGIIVASKWKYMLSGGDLSQVYHGTTTNTTLSSPLPASQTPYTFTVYTDCSATVNGLTSEAVSQTFTVPCPIPTGLTASNITDNGFTISWTANVDCQVLFNGNEEIILSNQEKTKSFEGLNPETQYTVTVKAKCGNEYVEQASINVTTARLAAPTGLAVTPAWQSTSGKIDVIWDMLPGLTYEIYGESGDKVSGFEKTGLSEGAYTLKLRAKKGDKTSEWVSMPYTISNPEAPKNPEVTYDEQVGGFNVKIEWEQGVEGVVTWFVAENTADLDGASISNPYVLTNQQAGETFSILIKEKSNNGQNVSQALVVPIQVPCLTASEPISIVPALNSVTFNFEVAKTRKIFIGSAEYDANATSVTINDLTAGTSYAYEIREYCNTTTNTYSSINGTFSTLACYAVAGLSVSNVELTTATVSWTSQSSTPNLQYKVVVNEEEPIVQTAKTIDLTGLTQSTEYTVEVYEQCGAEGNWGAVSSITFTTKGTKNYISATSGDFTTGTTWIGGKAPNSADVDGTTITISQGHTLTLSSAFIIDERYTVTNNGILVIQQGGELINTTSNNVGGIIEVVTPIKDQKNWHFVGAPFAGYKLEAIKPVEGSDVAITT